MLSIIPTMDFKNLIARPASFLLLACGWGFFGQRGPQGSNALLASALFHISYGLGVGAVIVVGSYVLRPTINQLERKR